MKFTITEYSDFHYRNIEYTSETIIAHCKLTRTVYASVPGVSQREVTLIALKEIISALIEFPESDVEVTVYPFPFCRPANHAVFATYNVTSS